MNKSKGGINTNVILFGLLIVGAILVFGPQLMGGGAEEDTTPQTVPQDTDTTSSEPIDDGIDLGPIVVAETIDRDGCAVGIDYTLDDVESFYVIAEDSEIAEGTEVFVRLYQNNQAVEDLPAIIANQNYDNTCISFIFESTTGFDFDAGDYEAEFYVNGNSYDSVSFDIQ